MAYIPNKERDETTLEKLREQRREYQRKFREKNPNHAKIRTAEYRKRHPDRVRVSLRKQNLRRYGLTPEQYNAMVEDQKGLCKICFQPQKSKKTERLFVDHNHTTNVVRGLLCNNCNVFIGLAREHREVLDRAKHYLEER